MDPSIYRRMAQTQHDHWWFRARRSILKAQLERLGLPHPARVLEVGCGTGANLSMLSAFGQVDAMELDDFALEIARQEACADVRKGWLPNGIPFDGGARYDAVCLFDVLEHCENDHAALDVGADSILSHRADSILSQGWKPALRSPAVDKCRALPVSSTSSMVC